MIPSPSITLLLHTHERPRNLINWSQYNGDHLSLNFPFQIIIADSSRCDNNYQIESFLKGKLTTYLHLPGYTLEEKLLKGLKFVSSRYILLCADDDFYSVDWILSAVDVADQDDSIGVVYGEEISFKASTPSSRVFSISNQNPVQHDLSCFNVDSRLKRFALSDWSTTGWYAMQRSSLLREIIAISNSYKLEGYSFERFLIFYQALSCRTVRLGIPFLARETAAISRKPYSLHLQFIPCMRLCYSIFIQLRNKLSLPYSSSLLRTIFIVTPELKALAAKAISLLLPFWLKKIIKLVLSSHYPIRCMELVNLPCSDSVFVTYPSLVAERDSSFAHYNEIKEDLIKFAILIDNFLLSTVNNY